MDSSAAGGDVRGQQKLKRRWTTLLLVWLGTALYSYSQPGQSNGLAVLGVARDKASVTVRFAQGSLRIQPCAGPLARVTYSAAPLSDPPHTPYLSAAACVPVPFTVAGENPSGAPPDVLIQTAGLTIAVSRTSGAVRFLEPDGAVLLREMDWPLPRQIQPANIGGEASRQASVWFALTPEERIYGLGQHQNGLLNQRGLEMEISQDNTNISIPFFLSSRGYAIFWNSAAKTRWNNRFLPVLSISSDPADSVDYFFAYGPSFDKLIAGYRRLTGDTPLFPQWAYGFWQSKLAYRSQSELLDVAAKYRSLHIPLDNIVLDEGWETVMGSRTFTSKFPDPRSMVTTLHQEHVHMMASIWPLFLPGSANFAAMDRNRFFVVLGNYRFRLYYPGTRLYDAFSARARTLYWRQVEQSLSSIGVDAFWMDSTEPSDNYGEERGSMLAGARTAWGNGSRYANLYPFMTTLGIYDGQRSMTDRKRVFTLTRSAFAGMQHNAAAAWSGDVATNFATLRREIPAGLNYSMTGLPYWTTDIGGFLGGDTTDPAYRELFVRWFQYGAFCPIFRVHGVRTNNENELWSYGDQAQQILTLYDRLRYRLLPYIYSAAARTTFDAYTPMRALAFDFAGDPKILDLTDEFMFGPSLLVAPVTEAGAAARSVYLPRGADWFDFWTGARVSGGEEIRRETPLAILPLYVRAGSILPLGPESEYTGQHPDAPVELRVYPGADASSSFYEDDGTTYDYEKSLYARIAMHWDDQARVLTLDARQGSFPGMQSRRTFSIILVDATNGLGEAVSPSARTVVYDGTPQRIQF
ncbi:MAG TPA: TIM-barrel domain-containing protein [Acidobacteriaceae bacterium]|nr:TIM-barrel domain-containing protein [Acidobacteriaceae bacterium]